jgi:hypothetical protein
VRTTEGRAIAAPGDWIVEGEHGARWPVKDEQSRWPVKDEQFWRGHRRAQAEPASAFAWPIPGTPPPMALASWLLPVRPPIREWTGGSASCLALRWAFIYRDYQLQMYATPGESRGAEGTCHVR